MYILLYILWYAFWAWLIITAIVAIVQTCRMTNEDKIKFAKEEKRKYEERKRRQALQDPNATTLRNIYWLTFFNTFFKKK